MTTALQLRRGTTTQHTTFTGAVGEVTIDTAKKTAVVHDGVTAGGTPLAKESDVNVRVRYDAAQGLDTTQQSTARQNLNAAPLPGTSGIIVRNAADSTVSRSLAAGAGISVTNADGTAGNPTITNTGVTSVNGQTGAVTVSVSTSDKVSKAGDTMTGTLTAPQVTISSTGPLIAMSDTDWGNRSIHHQGGLLGFLGSDGGWAMYENNGGLIWTKGYGWLHDRFAGANRNFDWELVWTGKSKNVGLLANWGAGRYLCENSSGYRALFITNGRGSSVVGSDNQLFVGDTCTGLMAGMTTDITAVYKLKKSA